jgi:hypothetical protein
MSFCLKSAFVQFPVSKTKNIFLEIFYDIETQFISKEIWKKLPKIKTKISFPISL